MQRVRGSKGEFAPGAHAALKLMRADILLKSDRNGPGWTDAQIAEGVRGRGQTGSNVGKRFVVGERLAAFARQRQSRPSPVRKVEGQGEARLIALGCSDPPEGYSQWTLHLLADRLVDLQVVERISIETVRQTQKKTSYARNRCASWVMPPDENADFVAAMERGLDGYERPEAPKRPVVATDEPAGTSSTKTLRPPVPAKPGRIARRDYGV